MLGKIIVNHEGIPPGLHELFTDCAAGIGSNVLQCSRFIRGGNHDNRMLHGTVLFQDADSAGNGGFFLPDRHVNTDQILAFLVDDGIDGKGSLARLAVADDQFALAAADRDHRIDSLDAGLDGSIHILPFNHAGGNTLDRTIIGELDRAFAIHRFAQGIDHAADQGVPNRDGGNPAGGAHGHAFGNLGVLAHDDDADAVFFQVEGNAHHAVGKLHQFLGSDIGQSGGTRNPIARFQHRADIGNLDLRLEGIRSSSADRS